MAENYIITLECSKETLAELIATGLERHATITKVEAVSKPEPEPGYRFPEPVPVLRGGHYPTALSPIRSPKRVSGWDIYQVVVGSFHPQKTFKSKDVQRECKRAGLDISINSASAHLMRFRDADLITKVGGDSTKGFVHTIKSVVTRTEFERRR